MVTSENELREWVIEIFAKQDRGEEISPKAHAYLIKLVDLRIVGMDGFRYCWPEEATENLHRVRKSSALLL